MWKIERMRKEKQEEKNQEEEMEEKEVKRKEINIFAQVSTEKGRERYEEKFEKI